MPKRSGSANPELKQLEKLVEAERRNHLDLEILHQSVTVVEGYPCASLIYKCWTLTGDDSIGVHVQIRWAIQTNDGRAGHSVASWFERGGDDQAN